MRSHARPVFLPSEGFKFTSLISQDLGESERVELVQFRFGVAIAESFRREARGTRQSLDDGQQRDVFGHAAKLLFDNRRQVSIEVGEDEARSEPDLVSQCNHGVDDEELSAPRGRRFGSA